MAKIKCFKCKEEKSIPQFIGVSSPLLGGTMPICRHCIAQAINSASEEDRWNVVNKVCQLADIPFLPEQFQKIYEAHPDEAFGIYCSMFRDKPYNTLDWTMYNDAYMQLEEEHRVEDGMPELKEARKQKLQKRWGYDYDDQHLEYLENLYTGITNTAGIVGALNEDQVLKICKVSLIIEDKIRTGQDFDKDLKSYESLCKLAGVTSEIIKDGNEFNSTGEIFAYLEKQGFKPQYYSGAIKDEVDKTMKDIAYWTRYLYINETGVGDEITERIENLKVADKLTNSGFDWGGYEKFSEKVDEEGEDFELDI